MGAASCAIWKSLLKHEREGKDQELRGLNPARSPKPPRNFCHFCFLFAKSLGWAPTFLRNRKGEKYPFSETGCFVGSGTRMCSPVDLSPQDFSPTAFPSAGCPAGLRLCTPARYRGGCATPGGWARGLGLAFLLRASYRFSQDLWECNDWHLVKFVVEERRYECLQRGRNVHSNSGFVVREGEWFSLGSGVWNTLQYVVVFTIKMNAFVVEAWGPELTWMPY